MFATIGVGGLVGWINGVLVEYARIDSFIATLGVGTILYGVGSWYTNGTQLVGNVPHGFRRPERRQAPQHSAADLHGRGGRDPRLGGARARADRAPALRHRLQSPRRRADRRAGAPPGHGSLRLHRPIVGLAGVLLAARLQVAQSSVGPEFLLPAFVGALLGATTVRPGRVNAWGTIIAVLVLAVGIAGLQQLGNSFFVEPIFQGAALIISVGLAGYAARRRKR